MKNLIALVVFIFTFCAVMAQAPQGMNYQAAARNSQGNLLLNQPIGLRFSIHQGSLNGNIVYSETQTTTTDAFGTFSTVIGNGTAIQGTFAGIQWSTGSKFLQVEIDITGSTNYTDMGTAQLMSVPYALYADSAGNTGATGPTGPTGPSGGPIGPTGAVGPPAFNPEYSDGTDSLTGVYISVPMGATYTVPSGKNLHALIRPTDYQISTSRILINGDTLLDSQIFAVFPSGTSIGSLLSGIDINGYEAPIINNAIYRQIANNPYIVPSGKTLYLLSISGAFYNGSIQINGVEILPTINSLGFNHIVVNSGSTISTNAPSNNNIYINGILK